MNRILQTASIVAMMTALAAPTLTAAQEAEVETEAEVAVEEGAAEVGEALNEGAEAVEGAAEATGEAIEEGAEATGQAVEEGVQATGEALSETGQAIEAETQEVEVEEVETQEVETVTVEAQPRGEGSLEGQIVMQDEDSILAEDLLGATVFSSAGERVGEIDNMIISMDGRVEGVVIGVGGFLGIGEKDVALSMDQFQVRMDENGGAPQLITDATREDLENAEEFVTASAQQARSRTMEEPMGETSTVVPSE